MSVDWSTTDRPIPVVIRAVLRAALVAVLVASAVTIGGPLVTNSNRAAVAAEPDIGFVPGSCPPTTPSPYRARHDYCLRTSEHAGVSVTPPAAGDGSVITLNLTLYSPECSANPSTRTYPCVDAIRWAGAQGTPGPSYRLVTKDETFFRTDIATPSYFNPFALNQTSPVGTPSSCLLGNPKPTAAPACTVRIDHVPGRGAMPPSWAVLIPTIEVLLGATNRITVYIETAFQLRTTSPNASFTYQPAGPQRLSFNASASTDPDGTIALYEWNFGDGSTTTSTLSTTTHQYAPMTNVYIVTLVVTDNDGNKSAAKPETIWVYATIAVPVPTRLFDTRDGAGGVPVGKVSAGGMVEITVVGRFGVPATAGAVALNVTVTEPDNPGFVTVYPCGDRPLASNLNFVAHQSVPNAVITPLSASGTVCFYTSATTHMLADLSGWFPAGAGFTGVVPARLFDTRDGTGNVPIAKISGGEMVEISVAGRFGVPASGVAAVALNVTVTDPDRPGFITVHPCGERPLASNLNFTTGQTVPNAVIAPVSPTGTVCFYASATTHLLADVSGWFPAGAGFTGLVPSRLFDTRDGTGGVLAQKVTIGSKFEVAVIDRLGVPGLWVGAVAAVVLNVTVTEPDGPGFVTVYPCGEPPLASNLNYVAGQTVPNLVIAPVSEDGTICFFTSATTHLLADVSGWFAN